MRTKNFASNGVVSFLSDDVYLPHNFRETHAQYLCQPYDYHLVMVGASVGNRGIIYQHHLPALRNQNMWCFRAKPKSLYGKSYIKYLVNFIVKEKAKYSSGSARDFFTKDNFNSHLYCQPEDSILKKFEELCFPILQRQANVDHENQEFSSLRDWLLPMLMNGQVKVN